jgi:hypothetical protein
MFENLTNDDICNALDELIACFGINEETKPQALQAFLSKEEAEQCVQGIASRFGLPVRINLSYVPKGFNPGVNDGFRSGSLVNTDGTGRGSEGITAQVEIPPSLPMFGSSELEGFPIRVRVSNDCLRHPETFVAIMAHELSHVLLASLFHPQKDNELYADLTPLVFGFREVVQRGRKTVHCTKSGDTTTTNTTTYGYLTDSQFSFACQRIDGLLECHRITKNRLTHLAARMRHTLSIAAQQLAKFHEYLRYLDTNPPKKMKPDDGRRVVQFHASDYTRDWQRGIEQARSSAEQAERFACALTCYTGGSVKELEQHISSLERASDQLDQLLKSITNDVRVMGRYLPLSRRLKDHFSGKRAGPGEDVPAPAVTRSAKRPAPTQNRRAWTIGLVAAAFIMATVLWFDSPEDNHSPITQLAAPSGTAPAAPTPNIASQEEIAAPSLALKERPPVKVIWDSTPELRINAEPNAGRKARMLRKDLGVDVAIPLRRQISLMDGPSADAARILTVNADDTLALLSREPTDGWLNVVHVHTAKAGWVNANDVQVTYTAHPSPPPQFSEKDLGTADPPSITVWNKTNRTLTLTIGDARYTFPSGAHFPVSHPAGEWRYYASAPDALPAAGTKDWKRGRQYDWTFWIESSAAPLP